MAKNRNLAQAKSAKKDEFYTQLSDIENELRHYKEHFRGKTVFCNCDDPYESDFFKYFTMYFNALGLKKLIATCYVTSPVAYREEPLLHWWEMNNPGKKPYKAEITEIPDLNQDGCINLEDVEILLNQGKVLTVLSGDGDFRSAECVELLKEADIVVTNPPFSLFREYVAQLIEHDKKFLIIGNMNAVTYKEVFPLIKANRLWFGCSIHSGDRKFHVPDDYPMNAATCGIDEEGRKFIRVKGVRWFTNLDMKERHEKLDLYKKYNPAEYPHYDNYDAIEVSKTADIPDDYDGVMGVPITFLDKYCPEQFEILGITKTWFGGATKVYPEQIQIDKSGQKSRVTKLNDGPALKLEKKSNEKTCYQVNGNFYEQMYARILIRKKQRVHHENQTEGNHDWGAHGGLC